VIIDLEKFIQAERPYWEELERQLDALDRDMGVRLDLDGARRLHYLYERVSADLAKVQTFATERETVAYLQTLVGRAYGEIHEVRGRRDRFRPVAWLGRTLPRTFRRHIRAFYLSLAITLAGSVLGGFLVAMDPEAKEVLLPFPHLLQDPSERVAEEEARRTDSLEGAKMQGSAWYMVHNTRVSLLVAGLGITYGVGTGLLLFSNGVLLGAVTTDYVMAGEGVFLTAWLLPHGSVEIPAILLAGQAGLVLAGALFRRGSRKPLTRRLRDIIPDVVTLCGGLTLFLVWAGLVEAWLSQYHEPAVPYGLKIALGLTTLVLVVLLLGLGGRKEEEA
jgi:uncharacterized membrane protein SpoIIM required for sporulation